jgi:hypothetical protein
MKFTVENNFAQFSATFVVKTKAMLEVVKREIRNAGLDIVKRAKGNLRKSIQMVERDIRFTAQGTTQQGGMFVVTVGPNVYYGAYVEYGTKPHWPPISAILAWVKRKGIGATRMVSRAGAYGAVTHKAVRSRGKRIDVAQRQVAFLIARAISRRGTRPHPYLIPYSVMRIEECKRALDVEFSKLGSTG